MNLCLPQPGFLYSRCRQAPSVNALRFCRLIPASPSGGAGAPWPSLFSSWTVCPAAACKQAGPQLPACMRECPWRTPGLHAAATHGAPGWPILHFPGPPPPGLTAPPPLPVRSPPLPEPCLPQSSPSRKHRRLVKNTVPTPSIFVLPCFGPRVRDARVSAARRRSTSACAARAPGVQSLTPRVECPRLRRRGARARPCEADVPPACAEADAQAG